MYSPVYAIYHKLLLPAKKVNLLHNIIRVYTYRVNLGGNFTHILDAVPPPKVRQRFYQIR